MEAAQQGSAHHDHWQDHERMHGVDAGGDHEGARHALCFACGKSTRRGEARLHRHILSKHFVAAAERSFSVINAAELASHFENSIAPLFAGEHATRVFPVLGTTRTTR